MSEKKIILASSSPARRMLMERLMLPFTALTPDVDETPYVNEKPDELVIRLAKAKANVFAKEHDSAIIIGVDQVGVIDNEILGKPITYNNAVRQLLKLSGKTVRFYIGVTVLDTKTMQDETVLETFDVTFKKLNLTMIENYLQKEPALQCAGSLQVEGLGIVLLEKLAGEDYTALIGLPLIRLSQLLQNVGIDIV